MRVYGQNCAGRENVPCLSEVGGVDCDEVRRTNVKTMVETNRQCFRSPDTELR